MPRRPWPSSRSSCSWGSCLSPPSTRSRRRRSSRYEHRGRAGAADHGTPRPAVDWKDHFESIYHIENYATGCMVQVNAQIPYDDPKIATLTGLWHAADFLEREMWDLMGVEYTGHPNLTRILLPEDFRFHPLRKDFAQEVDRQYITRRKLRGGK
ncbi:MAG: NADH-quinone oxidoreductase subunit C [Methanobacteriota archaeon]|nr:MAG: NADH-quinone oxidoreductase subunit C [Euryarchaeota archaeon]